MTTTTAAGGPVRERRSRRLHADVLVALAVCVAAYAVCSWLDVFERFVAWSERHHETVVGQALVPMSVGLVAAVLIAWRRARHDERTNAQLRAVERDLAETVERYRSMVDYHPHAVCSLDKEGAFVSVNAAGTDLAGYDPEQLVGQEVWSILDPESHDAAGLMFARVLDREPLTVELTVVATDGERRELAVTGMPIVVRDEVVGIYAVAEDVTERNQLRRDLDQALYDATQASEARAAFVQTVSHEIRTPLASTLAATELLAETDLDPQQAKLAATIERSGTRLLALVNQILDFSEIGADRTAVRAVPFDLTALVAELVEELRPSAYRRGLDLHGAVEPELPETVVGDPDRLSQVMLNLLGNAVKFTDEGEVRLEVRPDPHSPQSRVLLSVHDTGIGIAATEQVRIFDPFHQVDASITRRHEGTGLGLAISTNLVSAMGGRMWVESAPGRGSTFSVSVPLLTA